MSNTVDPRPEFQPQGPSDSTHHPGKFYQSGGNTHQLAAELQAPNPQIERSLLHNQGHSHSSKMHPAFTSIEETEAPLTTRNYREKGDPALAGEETMLDRDAEGHALTRPIAAENPIKVTSDKTIDDVIEREHYLHVSKMRPYFETSPDFDADAQGDATMPIDTSPSGRPRGHSLEKDVKVPTATEGAQPPCTLETSRNSSGQTHLLVPEEQVS